MSLTFTCTACARQFLPADGGKCRQCGALFCRRHLQGTFSKAGPICRICAGAPDHRHPLRRALDRMIAGWD